MRGILFEDTIEPVTEAKKRYGHRIALLGGHRRGFFCADTMRLRFGSGVRDTLNQCLPGGGYCLGTGNSVANYIPVDNYLAMLGRGPQVPGLTASGAVAGCHEAGGGLCGARPFAGS